MAASGTELGLSSDEFAFYFSGDAGVEAHELGIFLQRASTIAKREGAELRIIATRHGSLAVIFRTLRRSRVTRAVQKEFSESPIRTTGAAAGLVVIVVGAIAAAMTPNSERTTPLAKAGAELVVECQVNSIEIVTIDRTITVMDRDSAQIIRYSERSRKEQNRVVGPHEVRNLIDHATRGTLSGSVLNVDGELHFRPDGHRYLVPIDLSLSEARDEIYAEAHFRVFAQILTRNGQPDLIIIHSATRI